MGIFNRNDPPGDVGDAVVHDAGASGLDGLAERLALAVVWPAADGRAGGRLQLEAGLFQKVHTLKEQVLQLQSLWRIPTAAVS